MTMPAIEIAGVSKRFRVLNGFFRWKTVTALEEITFSVASGEVFGLVGPNGSGKSTLLRILSTVLIPSSGRAWIRGIPISRVHSVKPLLGLVSAEARGFSGELSARQNLDFFSVLQGVRANTARARIERLLEKVGIADLGRQPVWTYSTGQRQRLSIARALLHDPPVCFLDEPTKSLDPWAAKEIRLWIRKEWVERRGKTVLIASNQMEEIRELCDRVALLQKGKVVWIKPAREVFQRAAVPAGVRGKPA